MATDFGSLTVEIDPGVLDKLIPRGTRVGQMTSYHSEEYPNAWYLRPMEQSEYERLKAQATRKDGARKGNRTKALKAIEDRMAQLEDEGATQIEEEERIVLLPADIVSRPYYEGKGLTYICDARYFDQNRNEVPVAKPSLEQALNIVQSRLGRMTGALQAHIDSIKETITPPVEETSAPSAGARKKG